MHAAQGHVKTQREDSHLQARKRGLTSNQLCWQHSLGTQPGKCGEVNVGSVSRLVCGAP